MDKITIFIIIQFVKSNWKRFNPLLWPYIKFIKNIDITDVINVDNIYKINCKLLKHRVIFCRTIIAILESQFSFVVTS